MGLLAGEHELVGLDLGADPAAGLGVGDRDRGTDERQVDSGGENHEFGTLVIASQIS